MRINIAGDSVTARSLRQRLQRAGLAVTERSADITFEVRESEAECFVVDAWRGELEQHLVNALDDHADRPIMLLRKNRDDRLIILEIPVSDSMPAEIAVVEALKAYCRHPVDRRRWWKFWSQQ